jgi:hypothetical protein
MLVRKLDLGAARKETTMPGKKRVPAPAIEIALEPSRRKKIDLPRDFTLSEQAALKSALKSPKLAEVFTKMNPRFRQTLVTTFREEPRATGRPKARSKLKSAQRSSVATITWELGRTKNVRRVGVLDLGAWIGGLPSLLEMLNAAQTPFTIFEIQAPIPGGMLKTPEGMNEWAEARLGKPLSMTERSRMERQIVADEFFAAAEDIRTSMGLDLLVGMSPAMVAGIDDGGIYWNHFGSVSGKTILLSTADLRLYAEKAGRPFEAAVGALLVSALLVAVNGNLGYHDDTGCLFDYNESRVSLIDSLKAMQIEDSCLAVMTAEQRTAALAMLKVLKAMKRRSP